MGVVLHARARAVGRPQAFLADCVTRILKVRDGIPADQVHHSETYKTDAANSLKVYRANYFRSIVSARTDHYVDVPVQVIVNTKDQFVRPHVYADTHNWVPRLWRRDIHAGHWSPMSHPPTIARSVHELVDFLEGKPPSRALLRAQVGRQREYFGDTLVSVTGAGSGIGRATALEFAREGAEVVVSDVDEAGVKETAAQIAARGGIAHAYTLDVADADAVERFAEQVCAEHGVPDIVVNNAGVGHAGMFLDTPRDEYDRVLDINFGGVVNGCRSFGRRLVDRGTGGHIVNVSSMAAYSPQQSMNAYATSKAAVFMFGDCLRAELDSGGHRADDDLSRCDRHRHRPHHPVRRAGRTRPIRSTRVARRSKRLSLQGGTVRKRSPRPSCRPSRRTRRSVRWRPRRTSSTAPPTCCRR